MENLLLFGYIFIFFVCLWFGNFITSFYFRIPRGIPLNGRTNPPMCSTCGVRLKYPDYGPLYYYLFRGKKCKICGSLIPKEYFYIEFCTAIVLLSIFCFYGITEKACFMALAVVSLILCFLINLRHGFVPEKALWIAFFAVAVYTIFSLKNQNEILYTIITNVAIGFVFGFMLRKHVEGNFGLKNHVSGNGVDVTENGLPQGYIAIVALISFVHTKGITVLLFGVCYAILLTKKVKLQHIISGMIAVSIVVIISDVSFPYLEL